MYDLLGRDLKQPETTRKQSSTEKLSQLIKNMQRDTT